MKLILDIESYYAEVTFRQGMIVLLDVMLYYASPSNTRNGLV